MATAMDQHMLAEQGFDFILLQIVGLHLLVKHHGSDIDVLAQAFQGILSSGLSALVTIETERHPALWSNSFNDEFFLRFGEGAAHEGDCMADTTLEETHHIKVPLNDHETMLTGASLRLMEIEHF